MGALPECCAVLCCAVLCCAVLCCAVLCCAVLTQQVEPRVSSGTQGDDDITVETLAPFRKISTMPLIAAGEGPVVRGQGGGGFTGLRVPVDRPSM
jgi:hypothetical protein